MMKWWGWGDPQLEFPMQAKPKLWPWIRQKLGIKHEVKVLPVNREAISLPPPVIAQAFLTELQSFLTEDQLLFTEDERLLHSYGKSYPDLFRVRQGIVRRAPDLICLPKTHDDVEKIVKAANAHEVCLIPFGGGTNIVGGINPEPTVRRSVVTIDMRLMNNLVSLDSYSQTAVLQAGALGPKLEKDLQALGYSLGHFPDSFEYSTLGGWLATRSAGMQSDAYGKIEDMVVSLRVVTPTGTVTTRLTPASSAGPDLNRLLVGSEGVLGIITEATMRVHRFPKVRDYRGFLFKNFDDGVNAIHECIDKGFLPSLIRLQDEGETELAFNMKAPKKGLAGLIEKPIKAYLKKNGYHAPCIMVMGFEGDENNVGPVRKQALTILKKHHAFSLGASVGKTWSADKFNIPYLRDYVMDYGCMVDVAETAAVWTNLVPLYRATIKAIKEKFAAEEGGDGYVGCHISHTYQTGACLYFTYAAKQKKGQELPQYYSYKRLVTDTFMATGGTLSHHHAVGTEHRPWMEQEVTATGLKALRALKTALDPKGILNPDKLIPTLVVDSAGTVDEHHQSRASFAGEVAHHTHEQSVHGARDNNPSTLI